MRNKLAFDYIIFKMIIMIPLFLIKGLYLEIKFKMKKTLLLTLTVFLFNLSAQKTKAILYFKDGEQKEGYGKLAASNSVKFKDSKKGKVEKYTRDDLKAVKIYTDEGIKKYVYVKVENYKKSILINEVMKGDLTLYKETQYNSASSGFAVGASNMNTGMGIGLGGGSSKTTQYFLLKKGRDEAVNFGKKGEVITKNFKKVAKESFEECPSFLTKVENGDFKRKDIVEMVEFYNENCAN